MGEAKIMDLVGMDGFLMCIPLFSLEQYFKENSLENVYHGLGLSTS
jgi:hypothetical protein